MAIIVVSHQMGAGGPEIGMSLAQRLGYRYVNQELLLDAARRYGLAEDKLSHLDESKPTLFERFDTETRHHITVLQTTCLEFAEDDNCVLMRGHGMTVVGDSVQEAVFRAIYTEMNARLQLQATALEGPIAFLSDEEGRRSTAANRGTLERPWELWKTRALRATRR